MSLWLQFQLGYNSLWVRLIVQLPQCNSAVPLIKPSPGSRMPHTTILQCRLVKKNQKKKTWWWRHVNSLCPKVKGLKDKRHINMVCWNIWDNGVINLLICPLTQYDTLVLYNSRAKTEEGDCDISNILRQTVCQDELSFAGSNLQPKHSGSSLILINISAFLSSLSPPPLFLKHLVYMCCSSCRGCHIQ